MPWLQAEKKRSIQCITSIKKTKIAIIHHIVLVRTVATVQVKL